MLTLLEEELPSDPIPALDLPIHYDTVAMNIPPLMDWQHITEQITIILEEITHLTTEFAQLQNRVKWLEDHYSSPPIPRSQQPQAPPAPRN
ncbi:unnamed protein product [Rhizophagus irregularis]|nr:unnamed protein product [Rhizophagus irregularis]